MLPTCSTAAPARQLPPAFARRASLADRERAGRRLALPRYVISLATARMTTTTSLVEPLRLALLLLRALTLSGARDSTLSLTPSSRIWNRALSSSAAAPALPTSKCNTNLREHQWRAALHTLRASDAPGSTGCGKERLAGRASPPARYSQQRGAAKTTGGIRRGAAAQQPGRTDGGKKGGSARSRGRSADASLPSTRTRAAHKESPWAATGPATRRTRRAHVLRLAPYHGDGRAPGQPNKARAGPLAAAPLALAGCGGLERIIAVAGQRRTTSPRTPHRRARAAQHSDTLCACRGGPSCGAGRAASLVVSQGTLSTQVRRTGGKGPGHCSSRQQGGQRRHRPL